MASSTSILNITYQPVESLQHRFGVNLVAPDVDTMVVTSETSVGIELVRQLQEFATRPPLMKPQKYIIIPAAETLTIEAQNALLKLLEEPPAYLQIILCAPHTQTFLDTVLSRCRILRDNNPPNPGLHTTHYTLNTILQSPPAARLSLLPSTKDREAITSYVRQLIDTAQTQLSLHPSGATAHNLELLATCLDHLSKNANPTMTLADTFLHMENPAIDHKKA